MSVFAVSLYVINNTRFLGVSKTLDSAKELAIKVHEQLLAYDNDRIHEYNEETDRLNDLYPHGSRKHIKPRLFPMIEWSQQRDHCCYGHMVNEYGVTIHYDGVNELYSFCIEEVEFDQLSESSMDMLKEEFE